eukprot:jgi/Hompol1/6243/HPOL_003447-RA
MPGPTALDKRKRDGDTDETKDSLLLAPVPELQIRSVTAAVQRTADQGFSHSRCHLNIGTNIIANLIQKKQIVDAASQAARPQPIAATAPSTASEGKPAATASPTKPNAASPAASPTRSASPVRASTPSNSAQPQHSSSALSTSPDLNKSASASSAKQETTSISTPVAVRGIKQSSLGFFQSTSPEPKVPTTPFANLKTPSGSKFGSGSAFGSFGTSTAGTLSFGAAAASSVSFASILESSAIETPISKLGSKSSFGSGLKKRTDSNWDDGEDGNENGDDEDDNEAGEPNSGRESPKFQSVVTLENKT